MTESIVRFFSQFPPELATLLMAMTPVGELRLALPVAIFGYHLPVWQAFFWSVLGNMIPPTLILLFADRFHRYLENNSGFFGRAWVKSLARAQAKFAQYQKYEQVGLMIFIGIPLPMTGAWTGALAAFVLGLTFKKSWPFVIAGVIMSGIITLIITLGAGKIF